jgi:RimJ/RimL family protein N-acetyltransferase
MFPVASAPVNALQIRKVDPRDEAALRSWWEVGRDASAERPLEAWPVWEVARAMLPVARTDGRLVLLEAVRDGLVVGSARLWFFLRDNTHLVEAGVWVTPQARRRGVGRALLGEVEARTRADGRTTVIGSAFAPVDAESPGSLFAAAMGYPVGSHEETKVVDLKTAPSGWGALEDEVAGALGGYRAEVFVERLPDAYLPGFCELLSAFLGEVPTGDLDLREAAWTPERLRENEERAVATGRCQVIAVAVAPDGTLAGFSDATVHRADPRHAAVGGTLVLPRHRGHRLGLAMKLLTHRRVAELFPECGYVETGNAGVNAPMNAVNERMGYRVVERCLDVQKQL